MFLSVPLRRVRKGAGRYQKVELVRNSVKHFLLKNKVLEDNLKLN